MTGPPMKLVHTVDWPIRGPLGHVIAEDIQKATSWMMNRRGIGPGHALLSAENHAAVLTDLKMADPDAGRPFVLACPAGPLTVLAGPVPNSFVRVYSR